MNDTSVCDAIREAIHRALPDAQIEVDGAGGHFRIQVVAEAFRDKNMLESQRLVLGAIAPLMKGDTAPVHAIDSLKTRAP